MKDRRWSGWARTAWLGMAAGLALILTGDQGAQTAMLVGIDPLEAMNSRIKPNIMIVVDTSGSMKWSVNQDVLSVGADDPTSRMAIIKTALSNALTVYQGQANFGLATFQAADSDKTLSGSNSPKQDYDGDGRFDGPLIYTTTDPTGAYWAGRFNTVSDSSALYTVDPALSFMNTTPFDTPHPADRDAARARLRDARRVPRQLLRLRGRWRERRRVLLPVRDLPAALRGRSSHGLRPDRSRGHGRGRVHCGQRAGDQGSPPSRAAPGRQREPDERLRGSHGHRGGQPTRGRAPRRPADVGGPGPGQRGHLPAHPGGLTEGLHPPDHRQPERPFGHRGSPWPPPRPRPCSTEPRRSRRSSSPWAPRATA